ncbi:hypothetical protein LCGC14_2361380, partial [marine sediment metagenome]
MSAFASLGTSMGRGDGAGPPEVFTTIADVVSISGPEFTQDLVDTTTLASANRFEEAISTLIRTGNVTLGLNFDPADATQIQMITDMIGG